MDDEPPSHPRNRRRTRPASLHRHGTERQPQRRARPDGRIQQELPEGPGQHQARAVRSPRPRHHYADRIHLLSAHRQLRPDGSQIRQRHRHASTRQARSASIRPGTNHVETHAASGADQARFETFLTLGFGGSGADLAKAWNITDQGTDNHRSAVKVEKLDLVSKDPSVQGQLHPHHHLGRSSARRLAQAGILRSRRQHQHRDLLQHPLNQPIDRKPTPSSAKASAS